MDILNILAIGILLYLTITKGEINNKLENRLIGLQTFICGMLGIGTTLEFTRDVLLFSPTASIISSVPLIILMGYGAQKIITGTFQYPYRKLLYVLLGCWSGLTIMELFIYLKQ